MKIENQTVLKCNHSTIESLGNQSELVTTTEIKPENHDREVSRAFVLYLSDGYSLLWWQTRGGEKILLGAILRILINATQIAYILIAGFGLLVM